MYFKPSFCYGEKITDSSMPALSVRLPLVLLLSTVWHVENVDHCRDPDIVSVRVPLHRPPTTLHPRHFSKNSKTQTRWTDRRETRTIPGAGNIPVRGFCPVVAKVGEISNGISHVVIVDRPLDETIRRRERQGVAGIRAHVWLFSIPCPLYERTKHTGSEDRCAVLARLLHHAVRPYRSPSPLP